MIDGMNHFTVITEDLPATLDFYVGLLGLENGPRPDLGFAGAWLYAGGSPVLHVVANKPVPPGVAGVIDHLAFTARNLRDVKSRLRCTRPALRPAPAARLGHLAAVLPRPGRREGRAGFRRERAL
jgi:catechol 2,3-dioxygenase-like lactoylglutathione lyase family enzyme